MGFDSTIGIVSLASSSYHSSVRAIFIHFLVLKVTGRTQMSFVNLAVELGFGVLGLDHDQQRNWCE
jgi:hypothetical protein